MGFLAIFPLNGKLITKTDKNVMGKLEIGGDKVDIANKEPALSTLSPCNVLRRTIKIYKWVWWNKRLMLNVCKRNLYLF